jgi:Tfp pilus assembly protein PilF
VQIAAYQPPVQVRPKPVNTSAVAELLKTADRQQQTGDMVGAAASVERALRIEPRNAYLWNKLAHVRMDQGQAGQAADLAAKSNSLAGADRWLRHNNWQLIANAKRKAGDLTGAREADLKAASLR